MGREHLVQIEMVNDTFIVRMRSVTISESFFEQLNKALDSIVTLRRAGHINGSLKAVIFKSELSNIFLAGADLVQMQECLGDDSKLGELIDKGHQTFRRIEQLDVPTIAAINGACLGGGFELALACDYRIASNAKCTKIGLPEVNLGILPAWGGTTRLPRLVGMVKALKVILKGNPNPAKLAAKLGLVDQLVHPEDLERKALSFSTIAKKIKRKTLFLTNPINVIVFKKAKQNVIRATKGNYPAPLKIIEVLRRSCWTDKDESFKLEKEAFLELAKTSVCKNLIRIFFLQEKSKKLRQYEPGKGVSVRNPTSQVTVVGAGTMGAGIAQWVSSRGINVLLKDVNNELVGKGLKTIGNLYVQGVLSHKLDRPSARDGLTRVVAATADVPLHNTDILVEAIVEDLAIKQKVLAQLEEKLPNDAIIATNTSALSINEMADGLKRPGRFVGIHFFNPVHKMKLVEVVRGKHTTDNAVYTAVEFVQSIGKLPVIVKDSPGFVVNRILVPYLMKAADMLTDGYQMEAIDKGMVKFGMPMGPFRLMDEIGLDICYHVATDLRERLGIEYSLEELCWRISENSLGKKTGEGFYTYKKGRSIKKKVKKSVDITCLVESMTVEARKVLEEGVIDDPDMLDFAMIMGTGFAPFTGGPLSYEY